jgi:hypothetical protein
MTKSRLVIPCAALLLMAGALLAQSSSSLRVRVAKFEVENASIPDAVVKAGQQAGVPLGIDASDPKLWKKTTSLKQSGSTLGEVLRQILDPGPAYTIRQDGRTIVIRPGSCPSSLLNTRIISFKTEMPVSARDLSFKLWMALVSQLDPRRGGFLGPGLMSPSSLDNKLPPVDLSGKTVWEILDWITATHGSAAWVAVPFHGEVGKSIGPSDLWRLEAYSAPATNQ